MSLVVYARLAEINVQELNRKSNNTGTQSLTRHNYAKWYKGAFARWVLFFAVSGPPLRLAACCTCSRESSLFEKSEV